MARFQYSGRNSTGALVSGNMDAGTEDDVASLLFGDSITPIEIREVKGATPKPKKTGTATKSGPGSDASVIEQINAIFARKKIEADELIMFARQMYSLTKAGLPLDRALKGLEGPTTN